MTIVNRAIYLKARVWWDLLPFLSGKNAATVRHWTNGPWDPDVNIALGELPIDEIEDAYQRLTSAAAA